jgi:hypothetical protein
VNESQAGALYVQGLAGIMQADGVNVPEDLVLGLEDCK